MKPHAIVSILALSIFLSSGYAVDAKSQKKNASTKIVASESSANRESAALSSADSNVEVAAGSAEAAAKTETAGSTEATVNIESSTNSGAPESTAILASKKSTDKVKIAKKDKADAKDPKDSKDTKDSKDAKDDKAKKKEEKAKAKDDKTKAKEDDKKAEAKKESKPEEDGKKGGLFHLGGGKKKEDASEAKKESADKSPKAAAEDPNKPKYKFDPALISVLKDINKSLKDSESVTKLEDPVQKLIAKLSGEALDKALSAPELHANRIVDQKEKEHAQGAMSAESWESGSVDVSPELKASVVALWAKKVDGLLTVEIVGNYDAKPEGASDKLGEFITVITAKSTVDKGFDIQSQQDVNFWIGKVADLKIDYTNGKGRVEKNEKSHLNLYSPITQRKRAFLLAVKEYEDKLAKAEEDKKKQAEAKAMLEAQQKQVTEALAKTMAEALAKQVANKGEGGPVKSASAGANAIAEVNAGGNVAEKKSEGSSDLTANEQHSEAPGNQTSGKQVSNNQTASGAQNTVPISELKNEPNTGTVGNQNATPLAAASNQPNSNPVPATGRTSFVSTLIPESSKNSRSSWDSPAGPTAVREPSAGAALLYPGRAVAGQYLTVAVVNPQNSNEQFVGLSFNGAQLSTDDNGKVVYQVPEDAPPGYSLHLSLSARPGEAAAAIEVLQPLATPSSPQIPNLESVSPVCGNAGIVTIAGHNFDGIAERNRVIIDGAYDATVLVSSPVQLKARLPHGLPAGSHTLCVSNSGLRSNPGNFDLVTVDLAPGGPDTPKNDLKKLMVKVQGTHNRVRVKLVNQSRDVIKLLKGDEVVVVTPGGVQNQVVVPVQRLRAGNYKIDAEILI